MWRQKQHTAKQARTLLHAAMSFAGNMAEGFRLNYVG